MEKEWVSLDELKPFERYAHKSRYDLAKNILKGKVLDIGCGAGYNLKNKNWFGIEKDKKAIMLCKKRGISNVKYGLITKIPFPKNSFDGVSCLEVIEHVDQKDKSVKEINRVLKKYGKLVISTPNPKLIHIAKFLGWKSEMAGHKKERYIDKKSLIELFKKYKFELEEFKTQFWLPSSLGFLFKFSYALGRIFRPLAYINIFIFKKQLDIS